ncbi:MAG: DMT family transporter [Thermoleophilia bacterium]|nr:DMT family transporter [Thermoleophilia bacterium]
MGAVGLAVAAGISFGALGPALRHGLTRVRDAELGALVSLVVGLAVALVAAGVEGSLARFDAGQAWPFLVLGLFVPGVSQVFFVRAIRDIGSSRTLILTGMVPLIAAFAAILFLDEPFRLALVLGTLLIVSGGLVLSWERTRPEDWRTVGIFWALGGVALYATRDVVSRWISDSREVPPLLAAACLLAGASLLVLLLLAVLRGPRPLALQVGSGARYFLLSGLAMGAAYCLLLSAFARGKVTIVSPLNATYALWGVLIAAVVMRQGEAITRRLVLAALLTVAGAAVVAATR